MKMTTVKKIWKWNGVLARSVTVFWILETLFFIGLEGWHTKANSPAEMICDKVVSVGLWIIIFVFTFVTAQVVGFLVNIIDEEDDL